MGGPSQMKPKENLSPARKAYLKNLRKLYYFISIENLQDYDQFYIYTIWLYNLWNNRVESEKEKLKKIFKKKSKTSRL